MTQVWRGKKLPPLPFNEGCGSVSFADREHGFVAPSAGERQTWGSAGRGLDAALAAKPDLWMTADAGQSWNKSLLPTGDWSLDTFAAFMETPSVGWLFGRKNNSSNVLFTGDGGQHWRPSDIPHPAYPVLYLKKGARWSSHFDLLETEPTNPPNRSPSPAEAATALDDHRTLVVQMHLLRMFVDAQRKETSPLLSTETGDEEQLLGVLNGGEQWWGWSAKRVYRSDDAGGTWYFVVDAPHPIATAFMAGREQLLARMSSGQVQRPARRGPRLSRDSSERSLDDPAE